MVENLGCATEGSSGVKDSRFPLGIPRHGLELEDL